MFLYFALTFAGLACLLELYLLISYVRCRGKYPPFVISFGRIKRDILQKAEKILAEEKESVDVVDLGCGLIFFGISVVETGEIWNGYVRFPIILFNGTLIYY